MKNMVLATAAIKIPYKKTMEEMIKGGDKNTIPSALEEKNDSKQVAEENVSAKMK
jgi:hypothetical protein